jgi:hypothetical protein
MRHLNLLEHVWNMLNRKMRNYSVMLHILNDQKNPKIVKHHYASHS